LTFDTEDFIGEKSVPALNRVLELLKKHKLTGLFFTTGHMAEKLSDYPETVELLNQHQIGFHTSSHSVHPTLFEFTDVEDYENAYHASLLRETSHVNPLTGEVEGKGGIHALKALFPQKQIVSFRAPGFCWTPPHLEALKTLGITYDFSTNFSDSPCNYNGITFYPSWTLYIFGALTNYLFVYNLLMRDVSTFLLHPHDLVDQHPWDITYRKSNPQTLSQSPNKSPAEEGYLCRELDLFLKRISGLQKTGLLEVTPALKPAGKTFQPALCDVEKYYNFSMKWPKNWFGYNPQHLHKHFIHFLRKDSV
jgi:peptidoglycan/xylan/chitin deacetylase (PgdA/CDA1 family)